MSCKQSEKVFLAGVDCAVSADCGGQIEKVAAIVRNGGVIVYPTATLYGIGGNAFDTEVAARIREIKQRQDTSFILLAADLESALALAIDVPPKAIELGRRFWPGPLTMVLAASAVVPQAVRGPNNTVAVRVDAHPFTRALATAAGCPLISTSANMTGEPPAATAADVDSRIIEACDLFVVDAAPAGGLPSTLVAFENNTPVILRQGALSGDQL
jgi:L-threonylcarbamoyladenylate synthase